VTVRIAVLTTQTPHHTYFVRELAVANRLVAVVEETKSLAPPYETAHPFEAERESWEIETLLGGEHLLLADCAETTTVESVNDEQALLALERAQAQITVAFGTGLIGSDLITRAQGRLLNLHGGDPERYRGLDTHLWAVWHRDWESLVTALHIVAPRLDTGDIVGLQPLTIPPDASLKELRAVNTRACLDLVVSAADRLQREGRLPTRPQAAVGRYYSFMPAVLKDACLQRWKTRP
jgi:methionyl-tRNA formyltransferase